MSATQTTFENKEAPFARRGTDDIQIVPLGNGIFAVSWQEKDGATATNIQDYDRGVVRTSATLPAGSLSG